MSLQALYVCVKQDSSEPLIYCLLCCSTQLLTRLTICRVQCALCPVHCEVFKFVVCKVQFVVCSPFAVCIVHCILCRVQCTTISVEFEVFSVQCASYNIQYGMCNLHLAVWESCSADESSVSSREVSRGEQWKESAGEITYCASGCLILPHITPTQLVQTGIEYLYCFNGDMFLVTISKSEVQMTLNLFSLV